MHRFNVLFILLLVVIKSYGVTTPPISAESVDDKYNKFLELRQTQGESIAAYDALLEAYYANEQLINSITPTSPQFNDCKRQLLNIFPYLEEAVYFYAERNNEGMTVKCAKAYVDLSFIYAFSKDNITERKNYPNITVFVASMLFKRNKYREAIPYYQAYLSTSDDKFRERAFEDLVYSYYSLKNYNDAVSLSKKALASYPSNKNLINIGLQASGTTGDDASLERFIEMALKYRPNDESLKLNQARMYQRQRQYQKAVGVYGDLYRTHPLDINVACGLAFNNYNAGVTLVKHARNNKDKSARVMQEAEARKYFTAAVPIFEDLLEANPYATNIARARAFCYSMLGNANKLQQANSTLTAMKSSTVKQGADPVLETFFKPTTEVSTLEVAEVDQKFVSDVDMDVPVTNVVNNNTYAIVFGNEKYSSFSEVDYAINDATSFADYCNKVLGIPKEHIRLRTNATFSQMKEQINYLAKKAQLNPGELKFIVYYAGHGIPNVSTNEAYLLPCDASGTDFEFCYRLGDLYAELDNMNIRGATVFLDACFSGGTGKGDMLFKERYVYVKPKEEVSKSKTVVFSAASGDQTAMQYADQQHGYFTYFLLKNLKETKGAITFADLSERIRKQVSNMALDKNNKKQTPVVNHPASMGDSWRNMTLLK